MRPTRIDGFETRVLRIPLVSPFTTSFGTETVRLTPQRAGLPTGFLGIEETTQVVRAGLNLRFGG